VQRIVDVPQASWWVGIAGSPDGGSILYSRRDAETADIMLVEGID
jgi:hypothetical protein